MAKKQSVLPDTIYVRLNTDCDEIFLEAYDTKEQLAGDVGVTRQIGVYELRKVGFIETKVESTV